MPSNNIEDNKPSPLKTETGMRQYRTEDLIVYWDAKQCSHAGKCWQGLPKVFRPEARPWITLTAATPEQIIETIDKCPTDALKYELTPNSKVDPGIAKGPGSVKYQGDHLPAVQIKMVRSGPLVVKGLAQIFDADGKLLKESNHIVLCSCGKTKNAPYCDGSHSPK